MKPEIKEFIIEEHENACSEWKAKIEEKYPDLFKSEIEVGKWYSSKSYLFYLEKIDNSKASFNYCGYGFFNGKYLNIMAFNRDGKCFQSTATDKEVKDALIAEAKKRGFKNVGEIRMKLIRGDVYPKGEFVTIKNEYEFRNFNLFLDGVLIFHDGKWATIIEEEETVWSILAKQNLVNPSDVQASLKKIEAELQSLKELLK